MEQQLLKRQAEGLQSELEMVKQRLAEVEGKTAAE
jgi:prefoldin subunit 5